MNRRARVLICGTGSGAHVLSAVVSAKPDVEVCVFTLNAVRAQEWREIIDCHTLKVTARLGADEPMVISANGLTITSDPQIAARGIDMILISVPAFMHLPYLAALEPYLEDGCVIVGLPGQTGFEFDVWEALGSRLGSFVVVNFESLPWICKRDEFGRSAKIFGAKARLVGAMQGDPSTARIANPLACLQSLLGEPPELVISGHPLGITLRSPNAYSHPPIMFGRWKNWDGNAVDAPPLFYQSIDEETAELLDDISDEVVETSRRIMADHPGVDLWQVIPGIV